MRLWKRYLAVSALALAAALPGGASAKTLTVGIPDNLTGLDPANVNDTLSQAASRLMMQGLYGFDENMQLVPLLAERFEVTPDSKVYTFYLRKGVKFHDGTAFDAKAVKFNLERLANPENKLSRRSLVSTLDHVEVVDDFTVKVLLKEPFGALVNSLAHPGAMMLSPAAVEKYGKDIPRNPVGTGPFKFKSWAADTLEVVKNDTYWKSGWPKVDGVIVRSVPENGSRVAMLQAGEAQFIAPVPPEMMKVLEKNPNVEVSDKLSIVTWYASMNTQAKPFNDVRVRQALNYAVDKEAFCKIVLNGYCNPAESPFPAPLKFNVKQGPWPHDLEKAKKLLAEAGYPNGFETEIWSATNTTATRADQFLQQQLAQVGVKLKVTPLELGVLAANLWNIQPQDAKVQMYYGGWSSSTGDADWALRPLFWTKGFPPSLSNVAYYSNPEADAAMEAGMQSADEGKRAAAYAKAQAQIWKDAPWIFLGVDHLLSARAKNLSGVFVLPDRAFMVEGAEFK